MKDIRIPVLSLALFLIVGQAFGQRIHSLPYERETKLGKRVLKKTYLSFSLPMMNLDLHHRYSLNNATGGSFDTIINFKQKSSSSFGAGGGYFFNLAKFSEKTSIALDAGISFMIYQWDVEKAKYATLTYDDAKASSFMLEMPIALVYKYGGEVNLNPKHKFLFSAGGGITPGYIGTSYLVAHGGGFKFRPFVMVEAGAHFGIAMKLRATYYPGPTTYIDVKHKELPYEAGSLSVLAKGTGHFVASLLIFFHANRWGDGV